MTDTHQQLRYAGLWVLCGWAFVALVVFLSLTPNPPEPRQLLAIDVGHLLAYAWLMFWFTSLYPAVSSNVYTAAGLCLMGIALEYLQGLTDYRTLSFVDMRDNILGVMLGWLLGRTPLSRLLDGLDAIVGRVVVRPK